MNRTERIATLRAKADAERRRLDPMRPSGMGFVKSIVYDFTSAPQATQASLLEAIGVTRESETDEIVDGLAAWGIFIKGTDHLTDEQFRDRLMRTFDDTVVVGDAASSCEIIDMNPDGLHGDVAVERDATLPRRQA